MTRVLIIGFGRVGSHLYNVLRSRKRKFSVSAIRTSHSKLSKRAVKDSDLIFICTQDDKIKNAVKNIINTGINLRGKIAAHTSGALDSGEISELKKRGCITASFHPVQTFYRKGRSKDNFFRNIYVAVEGDKPALNVLNRIAREAGSIPVYIDKKFKTFHHICCVMSSSFVAANLSVIRDIYAQKNGFKKVNFFNIYKPLMLQTISNVASEGIERALTGPIVRNDIKTLSNHMSMLGTLGDSEIIDYYRLMSSKALGIAAKKNSLTKKQIHKLEKLLKSNNRN